MVDIGRPVGLVLVLALVGCSESSEGIPHGGGSTSTGGSGGQAGQGGGGGSGATGGSGGAGGVVPACVPETAVPIPAFATGDQLVTEPFVGIRVVHRTTQQPRPLNYQVVQILPDAAGIGFKVSPQNGDGQLETNHQTTRAYLEQEGAQLAINAHFFTPYPSPDLYANLSGIAASEGDAYSPFEGIHTFGFNLDPSNQPAVIIQAAGDTTGYTTEPPVTLHNTVGASEQIVTAGSNSADWPVNHPRTAIGVTESGVVVMIVVDGRQLGTTDGMTTTEVADILIQDFGVVDAINLDGGGSSTLAVADPTPRVANTTPNGTERSV
ncbi:MAG: phosphodiester glycosidase family protein, partial [Deltaproteobacteria bacterium]|nr:phosphodiester glycosidase family protein [Deltaproteobacteria bacterium]